MITRVSGFGQSLIYKKLLIPDLMFSMLTLPQHSCRSTLGGLLMTRIHDFDLLLNDELIRIVVLDSLIYGCYNKCKTLK